MLGRIGRAADARGSRRADARFARGVDRGRVQADGLPILSAVARGGVREYAGDVTATCGALLEDPAASLRRRVTPQRSCGVFPYRASALARLASQSQPPHLESQ